jgi:hypothetical protein
MEPRTFHPPTAKQARVIWMGVTALSVAVFLAVLAIIFWAAGWALTRLTPVLLPLAIAGIIAYLLDPIVDYLERKRVSRAWAILLVFFLGLGVVVAISATVIPRLVVETKDLVERVPVYRDRIIDATNEWMEKSPWGQRFKEAWANDLEQNRLVVWAPGRHRDGPCLLVLPAAREARHQPGMDKLSPRARIPMERRNGLHHSTDQ